MPASDRELPVEENEPAGDLSHSLATRAQWVRRAVSPWVRRWLPASGGSGEGEKPGPAATLTAGHTTHMVQRAAGRKQVRRPAIGSVEPETFARFAGEIAARFPDAGGKYGSQPLEVGDQDSADLALAGRPVQLAPEIAEEPAEPEPEEPGSWPEMEDGGQEEPPPRPSLAEMRARWEARQQGSVEPSFEAPDQESQEPRTRPSLAEMRARWEARQGAQSTPGSVQRAPVSLQRQPTPGAAPGRVQRTTIEAPWTGDAGRPPTRRPRVVSRIEELPSPGSSSIGQVRRPESGPPPAAPAQPGRQAGPAPVQRAAGEPAGPPARPKAQQAADEVLPAPPETSEQTPRVQAQPEAAPPVQRAVEGAVPTPGTVPQGAPDTPLQPAEMPPLPDRPAEKPGLPARQEGVLPAHTEERPLQQGAENVRPAPGQPVAQGASQVQRVIETPPVLEQPGQQTSAGTVDAVQEEAAAPQKGAPPPVQRAPQEGTIPSEAPVEEAPEGPPTTSTAAGKAPSLPVQWEEEPAAPLLQAKPSTGPQQGAPPPVQRAAQEGAALPEAPIEEAPEEPPAAGTAAGEAPGGLIRREAELAAPVLQAMPDAAARQGTPPPVQRAAQEEAALPEVPLEEAAEEPPAAGTVTGEAPSVPIRREAEPAAPVLQARPDAAPQPDALPPVQRVEETLGRPAEQAPPAHAAAEGAALPERAAGEAPGIPEGRPAQEAAPLPETMGGVVPDVSAQPEGTPPVQREREGLPPAREPEVEEARDVSAERAYQQATAETPPVPAQPAESLPVQRTVVEIPPAPEGQDARPVEGALPAQQAPGETPLAREVEVGQAPGVPPVQRKTEAAPPVPETAGGNAPDAAGPVAAPGVRQPAEEGSTTPGPGIDTAPPAAAEQRGTTPGVQRAAQAPPAPGAAPEEEPPVSEAVGETGPHAPASREAAPGVQRQAPGALPVPETASGQAPDVPATEVSPSAVEVRRAGGQAPPVPEAAGGEPPVPGAAVEEGRGLLPQHEQAPRVQRAAKAPPAVRKAAAAHAPDAAGTAGDGLSVPGTAVEEAPRIPAPQDSAQVPGAPVPPEGEMRAPEARDAGRQAGQPAPNLGDEILARAATRAHLPLTGPLRTAGRLEPLPEHAGNPAQPDAPRPSASGYGGLGHAASLMRTPLLPQARIQARVEGAEPGAPLQREALPARLTGTGAIPARGMAAERPALAPVAAGWPSDAREELPLPPLGRPSPPGTLQRQGTVPEMRSHSVEAAPGAVEVVQRAEDGPAEPGVSGEKEPELDLGDLARQVYPLIKRMLTVERDRSRSR